MARVLVTEEIADTGLGLLGEAGHEVDVRIDLAAVDLLDAVAGAEALIIRSATKVTAEVLDAGTELVVIGRAGIGLDNVDVGAATARGVMVVNAPQSNVLSAAEHTMALLLAQARNIPQAHSALTAGRWERSRWEGVELADKILGVVGLGRIGKLVAQRALAFGMRVIAFDPYVASERARQLNVELVDLDELMSRSDFVAVHVAKTAETAGLIGREVLARAKPGLRIVNAARGGIVDEAALADAIRSGLVAGAAFDVFAEEPTTSSPLFGLEQVVVTPHLGASTREAQDKAGVTIAQQVVLALAGDFVPLAVNLAASEVAEAIRPFVPLAERLGRLYGSLNEATPAQLEIEYHGQLAAHDTRVLNLAVLKGLFGEVSHEPVTFVNAPRIAADRGLDVVTRSSAAAMEYVNLIVVRGGDHSVGGTLVGLRHDARIVMLDDHSVEVPPSPNLLVVRNEDRPGMIATVATALAHAQVNIDDMHLGRAADGKPALQVLTTSVPVPVAVQDEIRRHSGIISVHAIRLPD
jgi:D-3-phosphoglycerate dehydrogenase